MRAARNALAHQIDAVTHVFKRVDIRHLDDMGFIVFEIVIILDSRGHIRESMALRQFHIHHAAMDTGSQRNGHG